MEPRTKKILAALMVAFPLLGGALSLLGFFG
jgi:hypothetical protein